MQIVEVETKTPTHPGEHQLRGRLLGRGACKWKLSEEQELARGAGSRCKDPEAGRVRVLKKGGRATSAQFPL